MLFYSFIILLLAPIGPNFSKRVEYTLNAGIHTYVIIFLHYLQVLVLVILGLNQVLIFVCSKHNHAIDYLVEKISIRSCFLKNMILQ